MIEYIDVRDNLNNTVFDEVAEAMHERGWTDHQSLTARMTENSALTIAILSSWNNRYIVNPEGHPFFCAYNKEDLARWNALGEGQQWWYPLLFYEGKSRTQWGEILWVEDIAMQDQWKSLTKEKKGKLGVKDETDTCIVVNTYDARLPIAYLYNIVRLQSPESKFFRRK